MPASVDETSKKGTSTRKAEANRRNAQLSTGPKNPEGKAKSSQNAITHGIFVKKFLHGATPETVAEIEALAAGLREHYQPVGMLENLLLQKAIVEAVRCGRVFGYEQEFTGTPIGIVACMEHAVRYTTSASRAFYRAIEELERVQAARKARDGSGASTVSQSAVPVAGVGEDRRASQAANNNTESDGTSSPSMEETDQDDVAA